jgi:hypothetical protein
MARQCTRLFGGTAFGARATTPMRPIVLIIESRPEVAAALEDVITSARYAPLVRPHVEGLSDLDVMPSAIVVRIAFEGIGEPPHTAIERLPPDRPPIIAIAWEDHEVAEAHRLGCDVVLRAPDDVSRLCDALTAMVDLDYCGRLLAARHDTGRSVERALAESWAAPMLRSGRDARSSAK